MIIRRALAAFAFALTAAAGAGAAPAEQNTMLLVEAQKFMQAYADDLRQARRADLAKRYHPEGSYVLGDGAKSFESAGATFEFYNKLWKAPASFEWQDLSFEPVGDSAVLVLGRAKVTSNKGADPVIASYSALLVMVDGQLRIRSEDESRPNKK
jgi:hypothetical protein